MITRAARPLSHNRIRSAPPPGRRAELFALGLLLALIALAGCGRASIISPLAASPRPATSFPLRTTMLPQEAMGLVGAMTTVSPPDPTTPPAPPAIPEPTTGSPLTGVALPQPIEPPGSQASAAAAELIAAGSALQFAGACAEAIPLYECESP